MRIILLVNDSYFAWRLAEPIFRGHHDNVRFVVFSRRIKSSPSAIYSIFRKASLPYFGYRATVQLVSAIADRTCGRSVRSECCKYNIRYAETRDINSTPELLNGGSFDLGVAINCDQIIRQQVLDVCKRGILNVHASKLPEDPGISPVLWAFARGDQVIWSSVYKMDRGLDTGPIIEQVPFAVEPGETAFRLYERICQGSGARLSQIIEQFSRGDVAYRPQQRSSAAKYLSWPDRTHYRLMRQNGRRFISCADLVRAFATERTPG